MRGFELGTAELEAAEEREAACHAVFGADDGDAIGIGAAVGTAAPRACV